jgi:uncharacterized membrane protein YgdD (TMEM256/DUF423 family)
VIASRKLPAVRFAGAFGALFALAATALAAIGSHALAPGFEAEDLRRFVIAVGMLYAHALGLLAIAAVLRAGATGLLPAIAAGALVLGTLLFCGSLLGRVLWQWSTLLAPFGGVSMMAGWLLLAVWFLGARRG